VLKQDSAVPGQAPDVSRLRPNVAGIDIPNGISFAQWEAMGKRLAGLADMATWALADWILYGRERPWGHRYTTAMELTGLSYGTVRVYATIAARFERARRRPQLSFSHHALVASLETQQQDYWLLRAARDGWSYHKLHDELAKSSSVERAPNPRSRRPALTLRVDEPTLTKWQAAAKRSRLPLEQWALQVIDAAAGRESRRAA
jgi:hypothetical protein